MEYLEKKKKKKKLVWEKQSERMKGSLIRTVSRSWDRIWHAKSHCGMYDNGCVCVHVFVCLVHVFLDKCVFFFTQMEGNKRHPNLPQRWVFLRVIFASVSPHLLPLFCFCPTYSTQPLTLVWTHTQTISQSEPLFVFDGDSQWVSGLVEVENDFKPSFDEMSPGVIQDFLTGVCAEAA